MKISQIGVLVLFMMALAEPSADAQESKLDQPAPSADRRGSISSHLTAIEDILSTDVPGAELADLIRRIRDLADLMEHAQHEPSARIEILQRKLRRIRSAMGGAVETPDEDSRAAFEVEEKYLRREEARLLAEISKLRSHQK